MTKRITTPEVAKQLRVCKQRVDVLVKNGIFPGASKCECGRSILVPQEDVDKEIKRRRSKEIKI